MAMGSTEAQASGVGRGGVYRRLLRYAYPYRGRLTLGVLFGLVFGATHAAILWLAKEGLGRVFGSESSAAALGAIALFALLFPLLGIVRGITDFLSRYWIRWVGNRVVLDLRNAIVEHLNALPMSYFVHSRTGELISRATNDTSVIEGSVSTAIEDLAKEPVTLAVVAGMMIWMDPLLAAACFLLFPLCFVPVAMFGRKVRHNAREAQARIGDLVAILQEMIAGIRIVKAFGMEDHEIRRFRGKNEEFFGRIMRVARAANAVEPLVVFVSSVTMCLVLIYVAWRGMPFNQFITYGGALLLLYNPVKRISRLHVQIEQAVGAAERIFALLDSEVTVRDAPGAGPFEGPVREIVFDRVTFAYEEARVLDGISFRVQAGQRVAFVGSSGAGKTTLVSLLPRFFDVTGGAVKLNGRDVRDYTMRSLRRCMGIVTQDTFLFNDTVANNIRYGTPEATAEAVALAAKQANADEFIRGMPRGYDTVVGEHGVRLSGGQRQRLAIARAMLRNPPILILDEATSALDTESERLVQAAIQELMAHRTVFAIAHRLSTVANCDRILVLDGGRIAEDGTHDELLARGGLYRRLYDLQFQDARG
jgi:subfamily B ATP-binding cassette protein MsbA